MIYLLDTTAFSLLCVVMKGFVLSLSPTDLVAICTITRGEVLYGLERLPRGKRKSNLEVGANKLFSQLACLSIPEAAGDRYAQIKRDAERKGTPVDENDLWISATALSLGAVLVTMDSDFQRINGLQVEDWTK